MTCALPLLTNEEGNNMSPSGGTISVIYFASLSVLVSLRGDGLRLNVIAQVCMLFS